ncbi:MAG: phenylalanine--tRNA ligase subunit alpha [Holosporales bacterium]|jgi:phenylalanyl-tRNA synthetase alpha chain|nr:phenylalanine--tRNA ligase subunit alpha [Holosporales bacterium]
MRHLKVMQAVEDIEGKLVRWLDSISRALTFHELELIKVETIGKSGVLTLAFKELMHLSIDDKKLFGERLNRAKNSIESAIANRLKHIEILTITEKLKNETLDITLPVVNGQFGSLHMITQTVRRIRDHYHSRGFLVLDGPEIESDFFNFDALNIPKHHPARQSHDTFYLDGLEETLLRTHTSCVQIRTMMKMGLPIRMISIGKTYRNDQLDSTHSPMFHQIEGLVVDRKGITIGHLKNELKKFVATFFEVDEVDIRLRPSYFPFTEPGMEVDCRYTKENGRLRITKDGDRWLELGGAGMVHPNVFKASGIEGPAQGFAFGFGLERLIMLRYGISDIRVIFDTDVRYLQHYA